MSRYLNVLRAQRAWDCGLTSNNTVIHVPQRGSSLRTGLLYSLAFYFILKYKREYLINNKILLKMQLNTLYSSDRSSYCHLTVALERVTLFLITYCGAVNHSLLLFYWYSSSQRCWAFPLLFVISLRIMKYAHANINLVWEVYSSRDLNN